MHFYAFWLKFQVWRLQPALPTFFLLSQPLLHHWMGASSVNDDDMGHSDRTTLWVPLLVWLQPHLVLLDRGGASFGLNCGNLSCHKMKIKVISHLQRLENFLFFPGQLVVLTEYSTGPFNQVAKQQLEWNQESQVCPWYCTLGKNIAGIWIHQGIRIIKWS